MTTISVCLSVTNVDTSSAEGADVVAGAG